MLSVSSWFYFLINIDRNNGRKSCENRLNAIQVMFILDFCKNTLIWTVFETKINSSGDHMKKWSIIFLWFELKTVRFLLQMSSLVWLKSEKVVKWRKNLIFIRIIPHLFSFGAQRWKLGKYPFHRKYENMIVFIQTEEFAWKKSFKFKKRI